MEPDRDLLTRFSKIKLLLMDCDGVLTDGRLYFSERGEQMKVFDVRDGQGLVTWHKKGGVSGIITGRDAEHLIKPRCQDLGIKYLRSRSENKLADFETILSDAAVTAEETAYIGDDVGDLELIRTVGLGIAVSDAIPEVRGAADLVTERRGGRGAVREVADLLIKYSTAVRTHFN
jgi:YrbI family 3-deoxy-D-manno-octulosonate 8-phosphate phosphatase